MSNKNQRFNLLTACIVSGLHPNQPQAAGTKWEPTNAIDIQEAKELTQLKYAEECEAVKGDEVTPTWLQRQDEAKRKREADDVPLSTIDMQTQPDNDDDDDDDDEPEREFSDEELTLILDGSVDSVTAELDGMGELDLRALSALELKRDKPRKGVADAIDAAIEALDEDAE